MRHVSSCVHPHSDLVFLVFGTAWRCLCNTECGRTCSPCFGKLGVHARSSLPSGHLGRHERRWKIGHPHRKSGKTRAGEDESRDGVAAATGRPHEGLLPHVMSWTLSPLFVKCFQPPATASMPTRVQGPWKEHVLFDGPGGFFVYADWTRGGAAQPQILAAEFFENQVCAHIGGAPGVEHLLHDTARLTAPPVDPNLSCDDQPSQTGSINDLSSVDLARTARSSCAVRDIIRARASDARYGPVSGAVGFHRIQSRPNP